VSFLSNGTSVAGSAELDRKRAGVIVSSDDIEATAAWDVLFARRVGDQGSCVTLTKVIAGRTAVTMVALFSSATVLL
jgi:hypothetical protein